MFGRTSRTRAPEPEWENLAKTAVFQDDVPAEPTEDDVVFDCRLETLDLSERQKAMLKPIESCVRDVVFPDSIKARVKKSRAKVRKSRWVAKLRGHVTGKLTKQ